MKFRRYEKTFLVYFFTIIVLICFLMILFFCKINFIRTYNSVGSTVVKDNLVYCLVNTKELNNIHKNKYLLIDKKRQLIKIEEVNKKVLKRDGKYYHSVIFKVVLNKRYKENDLVEILFFNKKVNIFSMIKMVWRR